MSDKSERERYEDKGQNKDRRKTDREKQMQITNPR